MTYSYGLYKIRSEKYRILLYLTSIEGIFKPLGRQQTMKQNLLYNLRISQQLLFILCFRSQFLEI